MLDDDGVDYEEDGLFEGESLLQQALAFCLILFVLGLLWIVSGQL